MTVKSWKGLRCRTQQSLRPLTGATLKQTWYTTSPRGACFPSTWA
ncbi:hypothetical protein [Allorhizocola rhizosphaerae]|nr:hypothetical protein [Allorhizocola rhizosphaerae]